MYLTQGLHRSAQIAADLPATVFEGRRRTWAEVKGRVARLASGLISLGLSRGDRVVVISMNSDNYFEVYFAIAWAGGVIVPGNTRWSPAEHIFSIQDSQARFLMLDRTFASLAAPLAAAASLQATVYLDDDPVPGSMAGAADLIAHSAPVTDSCGINDDLAAIFYTGGTTGRPKGVMLSHRSLISNYLCSIATAPDSVIPIYLHSAPMFHLADAASIVGVTMQAGTHVIVPTFNPEAVVRAIEADGVTVAVFVPTMFRMLHDHLEIAPADLTSLRRVIYGASPISETLLRQAMAMFPNAAFSQGYGQTELSPTATLLLPEFHAPGAKGKSYLRSAGRPIVGVDLKVVNEDMVELPQGDVGEITVRSPGAMLGYWKQPELTRQTLVDGWVRTGDAGYVDEEGFLYLVDRLKDMIISGGENIFSAEVENALSAHASVVECAVIGVPDAKWGERVHAIVRLRSGAPEDEGALIAHCKTLIASYKAPRSVDFRVDPLPLSSVGKVLKTELRQPFWIGHTRGVG